VYSRLQQLSLTASITLMQKLTLNRIVSYFIPVNNTITLFYLC